MKGKFIKLLSAFLAIVMLSGAIGGCGRKEKNGDAGGTGGNAGSTTAGKDENKEGLPIVKDKLTIKFLSTSRVDFQYTNDLPVFKELEKRTNIHLEWQLLPATDTAQKFNIIMASGELPDMISYQDKNLLNKYGQQGAFAPLDELIEKNAPNIKKIMKNPPFPIPNLKAEMKASDGKIYAVPFFTATTAGPIFYIRQDWLDKLGLKVPETTDDLYNVLKAFKEKDPNGNGKADEVAFSAQGTLALTILMNAFGAHRSFYLAKDNTIKYGPIEDNYRDGLVFVNKLIEEKLVDEEFLSVTTQQVNAKIANNTMGFLYGWPFSGLAAANTAVKKLDQNFNYVGMLPVKGPKGDRFKEDPNNAVQPKTVITTANKYPVETIKYLDYLFSDEGIMLMNWGIENEHYKMADGKPQFTDNILKNPEGKDIATARALAGMQQALPTIATMEPEKAAVADPEVGKVWQAYADANVLWTLFPNLPLSAEQQSKVANKVTEIETYINENVPKFMIGKTSIDEFPKYVEQIKKLGIEEILEVYNEAYKKYAEYNK